MTCLAPNCVKRAISLGLCIEHFQRPDRKRRMSAKRKATIEALAEKYVAAGDHRRACGPASTIALGEATGRAVSMNI